MTAIAGKSNAWETALLLLLFNNTAVALIGDASGIQPSATAGSLYVGLASADPTEEGTQLTNEIAYTGYARVAVARSAAGWTVSGNSVVPFAAITFPPCTALTATATFFTVGASAAGAGMLLYGGAISPSIAIANGVTPQLSVATSITES
jgi:hypothetical protein